MQNIKNIIIFLIFLTHSFFPKPVEFGAWLGYWDEEAAIYSLKNSPSLKTISPVWYKLDEEGNITPTNSELKQLIYDTASASAITIFPTINNESSQGFDPDRVSAVINDPQKTKKLIADLVTLAKTNNYSGWDIDWEQIKNRDKQSFTDFISLLSRSLKSENLRLSVTVHAQTGQNDWDAAKSQDLKNLSEFADEIRVMVYDFHNSGSSAGPITPMDKLEAVLKYTLTQIPLEKLVIGLPLYGYDWVGARGESVQYFDATSSARIHSVTPQRDQSSQELNFTYTRDGTRHEVWFQDHISTAEKMKLAQSYGVYKFYFWRLGHEDPLTFQLP